MNFTFEPKTDEELSMYFLAEEGEYDFEIRGVIARSSQAGNEMLEIDIMIKTPDTGSMIIKDFLVSMPKMIWKIKHFCECVGLSEEYKNGKLEPSALKGLTGKAMVIIEKQKDFPPKNKIKDYIVEGKEERYFQIDKNVNKKPEDVSIEEDLPF